MLSSLSRLGFAIAAAAVAGCSTVPSASRAPVISLGDLAVPPPMSMMVDQDGDDANNHRSSGMNPSDDDSFDDHDDTDRYFTVLAGQRWLGRDWGPVDEPLAIGFEMDESDRDTGHGYEAGLLYSHDDDDVFVGGIGNVDVEATTYELYGGYRHTFQTVEEDLSPYLSVGAAALHGDMDAEMAGGSGSDSDLIFGLYARAGLLWNINERMRLGLDYRYLFAQDFEISGTDLDSDYDQVMLSLGWAF